MKGRNESLQVLIEALGERVRLDEPVAPYTGMRVGGDADALVVCRTIDELKEVIQLARTADVRWTLLGSGCNVLVADGGIRGLVIVNEATQITFDGTLVFAEAGALLSALSRASVERGLGGLEWAAGLPGTVGGAVVGNAGAFEGNIAGVLKRATVLHADGEAVEHPNEWFEFEYRLSRIKRQTEGPRPVVLTATFDLERKDPDALKARADEILEWRRTRHPSGATVGSTFKNPPDSHAGYLIEQAGLRGYRIGGAKISEMHGNFILNTGGAKAADIVALIEHAQKTVKENFDVELELEIELIGDWQQEGDNDS